MATVTYLEGSATQRISVDGVGADTVPAGPLVVHVDVDVIDSGLLPGLRFPAPGGPSADAVVAACERLMATGRVVALDLACPWWPAEDADSRGIRAGLLSRLRNLARLPGLSIPVTGDWNGNGTTTGGWYRAADSSWHLSNAFDATSEITFVSGPPNSGDIVPVTGDWNNG